jgi:hypothetical protein
VKYDLQPLDELIGDYEKYENDEVAKIINQVRQTAYSLSSEEQIRLYIQNHQTALLERRQHVAVYEKSDRVLFFLETTFHRFMDHSLPISDIAKARLVKSCSMHMPFIKNNIHPRLKEIISPLLDFEKQEKTSLFHARYLSNFWKNWTIDSDIDKNDKSPDRQIAKYLITYDFNPPAFFYYMKNEIISELYQEDNPMIQEEILRSWLKRIDRIPVRLSNPYRHDFPSIKSQLEAWLSSEIRECRKKLKTYNPQQQTIIPKETEKIETNLSVAQLACLLNTFHKSGVLINKSQSEILQIISKMVKCKKSDQISVGSLHNKYYEIEDKTRESVKEILKGLLQVM